MRRLALFGTLCLMTLLGLAVTPAAAQVVSTLYNFGPAPGDGNYPYGGLVQDASGNLYGTTAYGGANGAGNVFELVKSSNYGEKILYMFGATGDGSQPVGNLIIDASGSLYGVTANGGANGEGTVFELAYSGGTYTETILYSFGNTSNGGPNDGSTPLASLIMDASGNLLGTTSSGGTSGAGTVFKLAKSSGYTETVLYNFNQTNGAYPYAGVIMDASGNLFGTTDQGGGLGAGVVFELVNSGGGTYTGKTLYSFSNAGGDGGYPQAALVQDSAGNLYGTTQAGGIGFGIVFELVYSTGSFSEKAIYTFTGAGGDGKGPLGGLILDPAGNLYGTTQSGGNGNNGGTVFELSNVSGIWAESLLLIFGSSCEGTGTSNGLAPDYENLLLDSSGNLYGTTAYGGTNNVGTVFSIARSATAAPTSTLAVSSANPVGAGFPVSFTTAVSYQSGSGFPTGFVALSNANGTLGVSSPLVCGMATANFEDALTLGVGTNPVTATYTPASTDSSKSSSVTVSQTVTEPGVALESGGNTFSGNQTVNGSVNATSFTGNGAGLTNVTAANSLLLSGLPYTAFQPAGSYVLASSVGAFNGVASLDATGRVYASELPATSGSATPAILSGYCSGAAASTSGAAFAFGGLGDPTATAGTTCSNGTGPSTVIGVPVTSAGTLKNLRVYPGTAGNSGTSVTITVYTAAAPGWSVGIVPNEAAISALTFNRTNGNVTLTVAAGASFTAGDQVSVSGITGTYNAGTNCTALSGALFDGAFTVSSSTTTTVTYVDHSLPTNCGRSLAGSAATGAVSDTTTSTTTAVTRTAPTATALSCTIAAPTSAAALVCSDTTHTVTVNAGDIVSVVAASARTSGTETIGNIRVSLEKQ